MIWLCTRVKADFTYHAIRDRAYLVKAVVEPDIPEILTGLSLLRAVVGHDFNGLVIDRDGVLVRLAALGGIKRTEKVPLDPPAVVVLHQAFRVDLPPVEDDPPGEGQPDNHRPAGPERFINLVSAGD